MATWSPAWPRAQLTVAVWSSPSAYRSASGQPSPSMSACSRPPTAGQLDRTAVVGGDETGPARVVVGPGAASSAAGAGGSAEGTAARAGAGAPRRPLTRTPAVTTPATTTATASAASRVGEDPRL